jgi:hypothetical protein
MNTTSLLAVVLISLVLLITHAYYRRGFRLTFNFFLFGVIAALRKEIGTFFGSESIMLKGSPFFFPRADVPFFISFLTVIFGWIFTFYIAWTIAEKITDRLGSFRGKIFPTLLFAGLVAASISYAVETIGVNMGWWRWKFHDGRFSVFLVGDAHFFAMQAWFFFAVHFLAVYFLIECSKFRKSGWKAVFFLIYFLRTWSIVFSGGSDFPRIAEELVILGLLIALSFSLPLKFEFPVVKLRNKPSISRSRFIEGLFYLVVFNLVSVLIFLSLIKLKKPVLAVSVLPFLVMIMLAIRKVNLYWIIALFLFILISAKPIMMPVALPLTLFLIFKLLGRSQKPALGVKLIHE